MVLGYGATFLDIVDKSTPPGGIRRAERLGTFSSLSGTLRGTEPIARGRGGCEFESGIEDF